MKMQMFVLGNYLTKSHRGSIICLLQHQNHIGQLPKTLKTLLQGG